MSCHQVGLAADAPIRVDEEIRFRGVRRTPAEVPATGAGGPSLCDALVDCQIGFPRRAGAECLRCPRLSSWEPGASDGELTLCCVWLHSDPVSARMTGVAALVAVPPSCGCTEAEGFAAHEGVHRLLVVDDDRLVGIVCRCDLERARCERVADVMKRDVYVIPASASLGEAAAAMRLLDVGCLPVTRDSRLVGVITRGDLIRAGLPAEVFA